jgi:3-isopropylmalate dehydrogenase
MPDLVDERCAPAGDDLRVAARGRPWSTDRPLRVAVIGGDGIGPEVVAAAQETLYTVARCLSRHVQFTPFDLNADAYLSEGRTLSADDLARIRDTCDAVMVGAVGDPRVTDNQYARDILLGLRRNLNLYVNLRPVRLLDPSLCTAREWTSAVPCFDVVRENTEDLYCEVGGVLDWKGSDEFGVDVMVTSRRCVERTIQEAFAIATATGRERLCLVHKANALPHGHAIWPRIWRAMGATNPQFQLSELYVDAAAIELVRAPQQFELIVAPNSFGDILSDLAAYLQGGPGLAPSINYCPAGLCLIEPVHGSAPGLAGTGKANPMAAIRSVALLLAHLGLGEVAAEVETSVRSAVRAGVVTPDLGGHASLEEVCRHITVELERRLR